MCVLTFGKKRFFALSTDISSPKWPSVSVAPSPARPEVNLGCFCPLQVGKWRRPVLFSTLGHRWSSNSSVHRRAQESTLVKKSVRRVKCASQGCYCQLHVRNRGGAKLSPFPSTTLLCTQLARVGMWCLLRVQSTVVQEKNEKNCWGISCFWKKGEKAICESFLRTPFEDFCFGWLVFKLF